MQPRVRRRRVFAARKAQHTLAAPCPALPWPTCIGPRAREAASGAVSPSTRPASARGSLWLPGACCLVSSASWKWAHERHVPGGPSAREGWEPPRKCPSSPRASCWSVSQSLSAAPAVSEPMHHGGESPFSLPSVDISAFPCSHVSWDRLPNK